MARRPRRKTKTEFREALSLTLHRQWFEAIVAGKKKTEFRANKAYWRKRLEGVRYREVHFRNGYATNAPFARVEYKGLRKFGKGPGSYFGIRLGRILEVRHFKSSPRR